MQHQGPNGDFLRHFNRQTYTPRNVSLIITDGGRHCQNRGAANDHSSNAQGIAARVARERAAHMDGQIDDRCKMVERLPARLFESLMRCLQTFYTRELGWVQNKSILDCGCGQGDFALWLLGQVQEYLALIFRSSILTE